METSGPIELRVTYTFSDWRHANRLYNSQTPQRKLRQLQGLIALFIGISTLVVSDFTLLFYPAYNRLWGIVFILLCFWGALDAWFDLVDYLKLWWWHRKNPQLATMEYEFLFDESGMRYKSPTTEVKQSWSGFKGSLESKQVFLLLYEDRFELLPKRFFLDEQQLQTFRELIKRKIE